MQDETSKKIGRLSLVNALLVVGIHCTCGEVLPPRGSFGWAQAFWNIGVTRIAVPYFFIAAGYFLFRDFEFNTQWWWQKIKGRSKTLLVPYIAWSLVGLVLLAAVNVIRHTPIQMEWTSGAWWLKAVGVTEPPLGNFVLWFVRILILGVVIAPFIGICAKTVGLLFPIALALAGVKHFPYIAIGACLAFDSLPVRRLKEVRLGRAGLGLAIVVWLSLIGAKISVDFCQLRHFAVEYLAYAMNLSGIVVEWTLYDLVKDRLIWMDRFVKGSFFLYLAHTQVSLFWQYPLLRFGVDEASPWMFVVLAYTGMVGLSMMMWCWMRRFAPRWLYDVLTGGR